MGKPRPLQRIVRQVRFAGIVGHVTADQLLAADEKYWRQWRNKLTDGRRGDPKGYVARCILCEGRVYIYLPNGVPAFRHFAGEGLTCPWHTGENLTPDHIRKLQYHGQQESPVHRQLCKDIFGFISADSRARDSRCNEQVSAEVEREWRRPDVYADLEGFGRVAIELQLSNTFQTEISDRTIFYNREGIGLLWVFHNCHPNKESLPESLNDVMHKQRGNAFVVDYESRLASHEKQTLVLKCYLRTDTGYEPGRLVRLDQLTIPAIGCMYLEDRLITPMLSALAEFRGQWESTLEGLESPEITGDILRSLRKEIPGFRGSEQTLKFISTVLSIIAHAKGAPKQYASRQPNVTAMLNTYLDPKKATGLAPYAAMLESLIVATASKPLLAGSVGEHIKRAKESYGKGPHSHFGLSMESPEGRLLTKLVPEVFDVKPRAMLMDFESLPAWAQDQP